LVAKEKVPRASLQALPELLATTGARTAGIVTRNAATHKKHTRRLNPLSMNPAQSL
jgi:hypothetical protein